jgi:hypothetical protein
LLELIKRSIPTPTIRENSSSEKVTAGVLETCCPLK